MQVQRLIVLSALSASLGAASASAQVDSRAPQTEPCPDLGSFAIVDPPGSGLGTLTAQSYSPCADLPDARRRESVQIGVDVMIGGQAGATSGDAAARLPAGRRRP